MDLNGDGHEDILSGSYSRDGDDMAGLFQVLWGTKDGFKKAEALNGTDGNPLLIVNRKVDPDSEEGMRVFVEKICTRPFAADLNGDGRLDLVAGNANGTFYLFQGEGGGRFAPNATKLAAGDEPLRVDQKSDPFLVDWDQDGDLDLLSGSEFGGVQLALNAGTKKEPSFKPFKVLIEGVDRSRLGETPLGDTAAKGPGSSSRVWVGDVDSDGKLDILVGDSVSITFPAVGVEKSKVPGLLAQWEEKLSKVREKSQPGLEAVFEKLQALEDAGDSDEDAVSKKRATLEAQLDKLYAAEDELYEERAKIVRDVSTGYVWVYYQK